MNFHATDVKPAIDAFAKNGVSGFAPDAVAIAHRKLLAVLNGPGIPKHDLRGAYSMDAETADYANDALKTVFAAFADYVNAIVVDHECNGAVVGSLLDADPCQADVYIHAWGDR